MNIKMLAIFVIAGIFVFFAFGLVAEAVRETSEEKDPEWEYTNYPVNTDIEAAYDINNNGTLEPDETRKLLKERYDIIQTQGSTGVDFDLLQQYDADGDGTIDAREAEEIREDME